MLIRFRRSVFQISCRSVKLLLRCDDFSRWGASIRHLRFLKVRNFNCRYGLYDESPCQISCKSVKPLLRYGDFSIFFHSGGHHPSCICYMRVSTSHEEYLLMFVTVHNLAGFGAVGRQCASFYIVHVGLQMRILKMTVGHGSNRSTILDVSWVRARDPKTHDYFSGQKKCSAVLSVENCAWLLAKQLR